MITSLHVSASDTAHWLLVSPDTGAISAENLANMSEFDLKLLETFLTHTAETVERALEMKRDGLV